jgi:hypothetical protein
VLEVEAGEEIEDGSDGGVEGATKKPNKWRPGEVI